MSLVTETIASDNQPCPPSLAPFEVEPSDCPLLFKRVKVAVGHFFGRVVKKVTIGEDGHVIVRTQLPKAKRADFVRQHKIDPRPSTFYRKDEDRA